MQSLRCKCRKTELSQGARCPFCKSFATCSTEEPHDRCGPNCEPLLVLDLSSVRRESAKADRELNALVPSLAVVAP